MKAIPLSLLVFALVLLSGCNGGSSSMESSGSSYDPVDHSRSEEEVREDLGTREANDPESYLSFDGSYHKNLIGEMVIEGTISNSASIVKFKDAVLRVTGYSKTESEVGSWNETVYEVFKPGSSKPIKVKMALPSSVHSVRVGVEDAVALN